MLMWVRTCWCELGLWAGEDDFEKDIDDIVKGDDVLLYYFVVMCRNMWINKKKLLLRYDVYFLILHNYHIEFVLIVCPIWFPILDVNMIKMGKVSDLFVSE